MTTNRYILAQFPFLIFRNLSDDEMLTPFLPSFHLFHRSRSTGWTHQSNGVTAHNAPSRSITFFVIQATSIISASLKSKFSHCRIDVWIKRHSADVIT